MTLKSFVIATILAHTLLVGYGHTQLYEDSPCQLHDGSRGICKNVNQCQSVKDGIKRNTLRFDNIVVCSFLGSTQIVCCADEKPLPGLNKPTVGPNTNTDFVFESNKPGKSSAFNPPKVGWTSSIPSTIWNSASNGLNNFIFPTEHRTLRPISTTVMPKTSTTNPFWNDWSATQPNNLHEVNNNNHFDKPVDRTTTETSMLPWMQDILTEITTKRNENKVTERSIRTTTESIPSWMQNVLDETTSTTQMPNWMQDILGGHETTTRSWSGNSGSVTQAPIQRPTTTESMPSWMEGVLSDYSTTTISAIPRTNTEKINTGAGNNNNGGGFIDLSSLNTNSNDHGFPTRRDRTTRKPNQTKPPSGMLSLRRAEEACQRYTELPTISQLSWHILNGVPTSPGEFPWMAAIGYNSRDFPGEIEFNCGGTIISDLFILTAAHCNTAKNQAKMVRLGKVTLLTNDDENDPLDLNVERFIKHPDFSAMTKVNDIALIRVERQIQFTEYIRPACLRTDMSDVSPDVELIITGWGTTSALRTERPTVLLKTNVTAVSLSECNQTLLEFNRRPNLPSLRNGLNLGQTCAYDPNAASDACQGDSGGPLQTFSPIISTIVGVVSFGASCGTALPGVYTRVAFYIDWIESIVWPNTI